MRTMLSVMTPAHRFKTRLATFTTVVPVVSHSVFLLYSRQVIPHHGQNLHPAVSLRRLPIELKSRRLVSLL